MTTNHWQGIVRQLLANTDLAPRLRTYVAPSTGEYLGVFGLGVMLGAGLGLLLAPRSGHELRERLGERMHEMRDSFHHQATEQ